MLVAFVITIMLADSSNFEAAGKARLKVLTFLCIFWHVGKAKLPFILFFLDFC